MGILQANTSAYRTLREAGWNVCQNCHMGSGRNPNRLSTEDSRYLEESLWLMLMEYSTDPMMLAPGPLQSYLRTEWPSATVCDVPYHPQPDVMWVFEVEIKDAGYLHFTLINRNVYGNLK